ncbi:hypothetical protein AMAG_11506 [Allomyces macrogynus ATCC 38327]|uniref:Uncharacterized protein n=1 Tax=Allomyces macrogynus (strain ATCC 38327) TaxID=578462 RepID=A0A0L0SUV3_ALLM3|nr:hypothetical protein AMAG_11506 [Allomyces macrogynus ATCC 38327]|eukprot:KNE66363.1 hypothetical protein AMAG_11506 [Allomyces macrogynus ATCC 38327]
MVQADSCRLAEWPVRAVGPDGHLEPCFVQGLVGTTLPAVYLVIAVPLYLSARYQKHNGYTPIADDANNLEPIDVQFADDYPTDSAWVRWTKIALITSALALLAVEWLQLSAWTAASDLLIVQTAVWVAVFAFTLGTANVDSHIYTLPVFLLAFIVCALNPGTGLVWYLWAANVALLALLSVWEAHMILNRFEDYFDSRFAGPGEYLPSLEGQASWFSRWVTYSWLNPLLRRGTKKHIEDSDVWELIKDDRAQTSWSKFQDYRDKGWSFGASLGFTIAPLVVTQVICGIIAAFLSFTGPFFLNKIVSYIEHRTDETTMIEGYVLVFSMFLFTNINNLFESRGAFCGTRAGFRARGVLITELYLKVLTRKASSAAGKISNLFSTDAGRVHIWLCWCDNLLTTPLRVVISVVSLYLVLGWSAFVGIAVLLTLVPVQSWLTKQMYTLQRAVMEASDQRMARINEMLVSMRMIKFMAWEEKFHERVEASRATELQRLRKYFLIQAVTNAMYTSSLIIVSLVTFLSFSKLQGGELDATLCFTAIALFRALSGPVDDLAFRITQFFEVRVSYRRIKAFLDDNVDLDYFIEHPLRDQILESIGHGKEVSAPVRTAITTPESDQTLAAASAASSAYGTFRDSSLALPKTIGAGKPKVIDHTQVGFTNATLSWDVEPDSNNADTALAAGQARSAAPSSGAASTLAASTLAAREPFYLRDLNVTFPPGKLSLIVGLTASGKSSLLHGLLGEMHRESGQVHMPTNGVAYVSQNPWLMNATIRNNITFNAPYDEDWYAQVIEACALARDLEVLAGGDKTQVGERGIVLSGGQKQRLNLARATYSGADVYLFDDVLSALDAPTARKVFDESITGLLDGHTRILISHSVALAAAKADFIVVVRDGRIVAQGDRASVLEQLGDSEEAKLFNTVPEDETMSVTASTEGSAANSTAPKKAQIADKRGTAANTVEAKRNGSVDFAVYKLYFVASGGWPFWTTFLSLTVLTYLLQMGSDNWLRVWAKQYSLTPAVNDDDVEVSGITAFATMAASAVAAFVEVLENVVDVNFYLSIYSVIGLVSVLVQFATSYFRFHGSMTASRTMHDGLLVSVLRAPVSWFDATPNGRITNRFSADMGSIDNGIMMSLAAFVRSGVGMFMEIALVGFVVPPFLIAIPFLFYLYWSIANYYLISTREIKRVMSTHQSPLFSHFQESIAGASAIRAYRSEDRFVKVLWRRADNTFRMLYAQIGLNRWMSQRTGFADSLVILCTGLAILMSLDRLDGGLAGFTLSYALIFSSSVVWLIRGWSMLEINLNAVERIGEYLHLPHEPGARLKHTPEVQELVQVSAMVAQPEQPAAAATDIEAPAAPVIEQAYEPAELLPVPHNWPQHGQIEFQNVSCRYRRDLPPVLQDVTITVRPGERTAILGRTGAGKSSLTLALFRFLACEAGRIVIDGVDIGQIALADLRSRLTIIPQEPVCFKGTVRSNLDIFDEFSDEVVQRALDRVQCGATPLTLDMEVQENASSLSVGQRQLLMIARALLRGSKIIVLDEATASIDGQSDAKIQATIRESPEFGQATLLCIAHRTKTIIDFDRVVVLDHGRVIEEGAPLELLQRGDGAFYHMCAESGELDVLYRMAAEAAAKKNLQRRW